MLDGFNRKGVRRIMLRHESDHSNEKTEDAVTSMVFSPIGYMPTEDALICLSALLPRWAAASLVPEPPSSHELELWPGGLTAGPPSGPRTRCEPDVLCLLHGPSRRTVALVGEIKWDWRMSEADLASELAREREAVRHGHPTASIVQFVIVKHRRSHALGAIQVQTWSEVLGRLCGIGRLEPRPASRWASQVATFLEKADLKAFGGFPTAGFVPAWQFDQAFWRST